MNPFTNTHSTSFIESFRLINKVLDGFIIDGTHLATTQKNENQKELKKVYMCSQNPKDKIKFFIKITDLINGPLASA